MLVRLIIGKRKNYDDFFDIRNAHIGIDYAFDMRCYIDRRIEIWLCLEHCQAVAVAVVAILR